MYVKWDKLLLGSVPACSSWQLPSPSHLHYVNIPPKWTPLLFDLTPPPSSPTACLLPALEWLHESRRPTVPQSEDMFVTKCSKRTTEQVDPHRAWKLQQSASTTRKQRQEKKQLGKKKNLSSKFNTSFTLVTQITAHLVGHYNANKSLCRPHLT